VSSDDVLWVVLVLAPPDRLPEPRRPQSAEERTCIAPYFPDAALRPVHTPIATSDFATVVTALDQVSIWQQLKRHSDYVRMTWIYLWRPPMLVNDGEYQLGVTTVGLLSLGLVQRFAWNSVRWSKLKVSLWILAVCLSVHTLNYLRNMTWVGVCSALGKDERKLQKGFFFVGQPESNS
jgi:hypothetical protein